METTNVTNKPIKLFFQDEARFGRISQPLSCWAKKGQRPTLPSQLVREYTYVYGSICPQTGEHVSLILPTMETACFNLFLKEVSQRYPNNHIVMVCDGAASHRSNDLCIPEEMTLIALPPYSPELNPQENVWKELRKEGFYNQLFETMEALEATLLKVLPLFEKQLARLSKLTLYPWIKHALNL